MNERYSILERMEQWNSGMMEFVHYSFFQFSIIPSFQINKREVYIIQRTEVY